ncbi:sensor histidine kinase [Litoribacter populi]|uniref:sensor histidine kinase n=1 Tax=Litoribacter populi TaxID=2598460 RepID=UPI00117D20F1|nr:sensor histidine kinase [Litoribacter populi]
MIKESSYLNEKTLRNFLYAGIFMIVWVMNLVLFRYGFYNLTFFTYSLYNFLVVFVVYYILSKIITSTQNPIKWVVGIIAFVLLSFLSAYLLSLPFKLMILIYPDNGLILYYYDTYYIHSFNHLFRSFPLGFLMNRLYIHLILFFLTFMAIEYVQYLNKISELRIINANQELELLKSQIHPHFLFNTLNNLYRLVMDNEKAGEVVLKLSELIRFTLYETNKDLIPLKKEIKLLQKYIELEKINLGSNLDISYNFKEIETKEKYIAPMILLSIMENVLNHEPITSKKKSCIEINSSQTNQTIFCSITIYTNFNPNTFSFQKNSWTNIQKRLDILYPDKYTLEIKDFKCYSQVNLTLQLD